MKTRLNGYYHYRAGGRLPYRIPRQEAASAQHQLVRERSNGNDNDDPQDRKLPKDGKYTWVKDEVKGDYVYGVRRDGYYEYEVRYDAGPGDIRWMEEKDRNYILRLERDGTLLQKEPNADKEIVSTHVFRDEIVAAMQRACEKTEAEQRRQEAEAEAKREQQRVAEHQRLLQFQQYCRESGLVKLAKENNLDGIRYLLSLPNIDINAPDAGKRTALHHLTIAGNLQGIKTLVERGADIFLKDGLKKTPYDYAIKYEHAEVAVYLEDSEQASQQREQQSPQTIPRPMQQPNPPQQPTGSAYVCGPEVATLLEAMRLNPAELCAMMIQSNFLLRFVTAN